MNINIVIRYL